MSITLEINSDTATLINNNQRTKVVSGYAIREMRPSAVYFGFQFWRVGAITGTIALAYRIRGDSDFITATNNNLRGLAPATTPAFRSVFTHVDTQPSGFAAGDHFHYFLYDEMEFCFVRSSATPLAADSSIFARFFV